MGEAGGEVAAAEEVLDVFNGLGTQGAHGGTVVFFVAGEEFFPGAADDLPQGRGPRAAGLVEGGHCRIMVCLWSVLRNSAGF